jgi:hypothetical protein
MVQMASRTTRHSQLKDVNTPHVAADLSEAITKIYDTTVTGAAVTSVQFTGLDLDSDGTYFIVIDLYNAAAGGANILLEANGDTTTTNYENTRIQADGSSISNTLFNTAGITYCDAGLQVVAHIYVSKHASKYAMGNCISNFYVAGATHPILWNSTWIKKNATTNFTSIEIVSSQANGIGIGSRIILYQVKSA